MNHYHVAAINRVLSVYSYMASIRNTSTKIIKGVHTNCMTVYNYDN